MIENLFAKWLKEDSILVSLLPEQTYIASGSSTDKKKRSIFLRRVVQEKVKHPYVLVTPRDHTDVHAHASGVARESSYWMRVLICDDNSFTSLGDIVRRFEELITGTQPDSPNPAVTPLHQKWIPTAVALPRSFVHGVLIDDIRYHDEGEEDGGQDSSPCIEYYLKVVANAAVTS